MAHVMMNISLLDSHMYFFFFFFLLSFFFFLYFERNDVLSDCSIFYDIHCSTKVASFQNNYFLQLCCIRKWRGERNMGKNMVIILSNCYFRKDKLQMVVNKQPVSHPPLVSSLLVRQRRRSVVTPAHQAVHRNLLYVQPATTTYQ